MNIVAKSKKVNSICTIAEGFAPDNQSSTLLISVGRLFEPLKRTGGSLDPLETPSTRWTQQKQEAKGKAASGASVGVSALAASRNWR
jgi:hypothetical protein